MEKIAGVIPARYGSSRFPGKPLAEFCGRPMIVHVCERVAQCSRLHRFWVATDDERIARAVTDAGFEARMTPSDCASGSDRIAASIASDENWDVLVNIQGDEPRIEPSVVDNVVEALLNDPAAGVSTAAVAIRSRDDFESPHVVKVVCSDSGRALYFSRAPLPSVARLNDEVTQAEGFIWGLKHLGLYAYRSEALTAFAKWTPTALETRECLEQLRFLEHDVPIQVAVVEHDSIGVDTPEDLAALEAMLKATGAA